jgi:hypothetical protein
VVTATQKFETNLKRRGQSCSVSPDDSGGNGCRVFFFFSEVVAEVFITDGSRNNKKRRPSSELLGVT